MPQQHKNGAFLRSTLRKSQFDNLRSKMGLDRELRSSKRQRAELTSLDIPLISCQIPDQATTPERQHHPEFGKRRMPDCKTGVSHSNNDIQDERKSSTRKICGENSKAPFGRQNSSTIKDNQSNETNGKLENMETTLVKKETGIENEDASDELPTEHRPFPGMKPEKNKLLVSSLEEISNESFDHLNSESYEEKLSNYKMRLDELEEFVSNQGETLCPGWKVQTTRKNTYFVSPDNKRFNSVMCVAKHLKKEKRFKGQGKRSSKEEPNGGMSSASVCLNISGPEGETVLGNSTVDQIPESNDLDAGQSSVVGAFIRQQEDSTSVIAEHGLKEVGNSIVEGFNETQTETLSGSSQLGMEDINTGCVQGINGTQTEPLSGSSDPLMEDENMGDKNIDKKLSMLSEKDINHNQNVHWTEVLEQVLNASSITAGGIRSAIAKALASGPPDNAKKLLQQTISEDTPNNSGILPMKEVVSSVLAMYGGEKTSYGKAERHSFCEKNKIIPEITKIEKDTSMKESGSQTVVSSKVITECCSDAFLKIISSEIFAVLCNLIHGNFAGPRMHEVFDFHLLDLRMNAGTYGNSPELFASDMRQLWGKVQNIGQEMVLLADKLSELSQNIYQKEVVTLLEQEAAESSEPTGERTTIDTKLLYQDEQPEQNQSRRQEGAAVQIPGVENCNQSVFLRNLMGDNSGRVEDRDTVNLNDTTKDAIRSPCEETQIPLEEGDNIVSPCLQNKQCDVPSSGTDGSLCRTCGIDECSDCLLICDACDGAYHTYCLSPPIEEIPSGSWYCAPCFATGKESPEVDSSHRREKNVQGTENIVYHCVVCERLSKMQNGELYKQAESGIGRKLEGPNSQREEVDVTAVHGGEQELELSNDELADCKLCKICSVGNKDNDLLLECSNIDCISKFYHLSCLKPPLEACPPPGWYCPSCLCRACLKDENDDSVILCDGCDEGYHIYCLKPPLAEIPESKWYCSSCQQKQRRKRRRKGLEAQTGISTRSVQPQKAFEVVNVSSSDDLRLSPDSSGIHIDGYVMQGSTCVLSKEPSSTVTQNVTSTLSNRSLSGGATELPKGSKPKTGKKMKKIF